MFKKQDKQHRLRLDYWPNDNKEGYSAFRLSRRDADNIAFVDDNTMKSIFDNNMPGRYKGKISTAYRVGERFVILLLPIGLQPALRNTFLCLLEEVMGEQVVAA